MKITIESENGKIDFEGTQEEFECLYPLLKSIFTPVEKSTKAPETVPGIDWEQWWKQVNPGCCTCPPIGFEGLWNGACVLHPFGRVTYTDSSLRQCANRSIIGGRCSVCGTQCDTGGNCEQGCKSYPAVSSYICKCKTCWPCGCNGSGCKSSLCKA